MGDQPGSQWPRVVIMQRPHRARPERLAHRRGGPPARGYNYICTVHPHAIRPDSVMRTEEAAMATLEETRDQRVVPRHATWETYERLLDERGESRVPRFTYDRGVIEIMSPLSAEREECIRNIEFMVRILSGELGLRLRTFGSISPYCRPRVRRRARSPSPSTSLWRRASSVPSRACPPRRRAPRAGSRRRSPRAARARPSGVSALDRREAQRRVLRHALERHARQQREALHTAAHTGRDSPQEGVDHDEGSRVRAEAQPRV